MKAPSQSTLSPWERANPLCYARHKLLGALSLSCPKITCFSGRLHRSENQHNISAHRDGGVGLVSTLTTRFRLLGALGRLLRALPGQKGFNTEAAEMLRALCVKAR